MNAKRITMVLAVLVLGSSLEADAALCRKPNGSLSVRDVCRARETTVNGSDVGIDESVAYSAYYDDEVAVPHTNGVSSMYLTHLTIPEAGSYVVTGKAIARSDSGSNAFVTCRLGTSYAWDVAEARISNAASTIAMQFVTNVSAGEQVQLDCTDWGAAAAVRLYWVKITAIRVGSFENTKMGSDIIIY